MNKVTLDEFRQKLIGGGHRANRFRVNITFPNNAVKGTAQESFEFLAHSASMPQQGVGEIPVKYRGRTVYLAGDLAEPEAWNVTVYNTTSFEIRNTCLAWKNNYIAPDSVTGTDEMALATATIELLGKDNDTVVQKATLFNVWPTTIGNIELGWESENQISSFQLTLRYDYVEEIAI